MSSATTTSSNSGFFESLLFSPRLQRAAAATITEPNQQQQQQQQASQHSRFYNKTEYRSFYYSKNATTASCLFEQSLDVYKPIIMQEEEDDEDNQNPNTCKADMPIVALVVGSGWMGHRAMVYTATSWWNSSGPKSLAQLGCVCVCIRHRGAFPWTVPTRSFVKQAIIVLFLLAAVLLVLTVVLVTTTTTEYAAIVETTTNGASSNITFLSTLLQQHDSCFSSSYFGTLKAVVVTAADYVSRSSSNNNNNTAWTIQGTAALVVILSVWTCFICLRRGSATLDDMLEDVAEAMVWIQNNPQHLTVVKKRAPQQQQRQDGQRKNDTIDSSSAATITRPLFLLGGYSSGGHVAATLLQRPDIWKSHGLPLPHKCLDGALFVSGVMAVRADDNDNKSNRIGIGLTNLVKYMAFGGVGAQQKQIDDDDDTLLPSPLHNVSNSPRIPHLLIGCAHELPFDLPWLDIFFRSKDYTHQLQTRLDIAARYIELPSRMNLNNHWTILSSNDLKQALVQGFAWLAELQQQGQVLTARSDENESGMKTKKKRMGQRQRQQDESTPDAILHDSSYSEE